MQMPTMQMPTLPRPQSRSTPDDSAAPLPQMPLAAVLSPRLIPRLILLFIIAQLVAVGASADFSLASILPPPAAAWVSSLSRYGFTAHIQIVILTFLVMWSGSLAIANLAERALIHPLTALVAVTLWLSWGLWQGIPRLTGLAGFAGGGLFPIGTLVQGAFLALLLWSSVLWLDGRPTWTFPCGLAACVAPLPALAFAALGFLVTFHHPPTLAFISRYRSGSVRWLVDMASQRISETVRSVVLLLAGMAPLWFSILNDQQAGALGRGWSRWIGELPTSAAEATRPLIWPLGIVFACSWWCWRRAGRQVRVASPDAASTGNAAADHAAVQGVMRPRHVFTNAATPRLAALALATALASWCGLALPAAIITRSAPSPGSMILSALAGLAPLAATFALLGAAHLLERALVRHGTSSNIATFALVTGIAFFPRLAPLWLAITLLALDEAARSERGRSGRGSAQRGSSRNTQNWRCIALFGVWFFCIAALLPRLLPGGTLIRALNGGPATVHLLVWVTAILAHCILLRSATTSKRSSSRRVGTLGMASTRWLVLLLALIFGWRARDAAGWRLRQTGRLANVWHLTIPAPLYQKLTQ
jgi:hypothetical protein